MLRTVALAAALIFAVSPNASLLCQTECVVQTPAAGACHHREASSASMMAQDDCSQAVLGAVAIREDVRKVAAPSNGSLAEPIGAAFTYAVATTLNASMDSSPHVPLAPPVRITVLRI